MTSEARAKVLSRKLPLVSEAPDLVPARMINETLYCERLMYLEWAQGEFADNAFTVDGRAVHARADTPGGSLPALPPAGVASSAGAGAGDPPKDDESRPYEARALWLSSERLGVTAKIDVVEGSTSGSVVPIEYKRGAVPDVPEGAHLPERAQLCAQVLLLRDAGHPCEYGEIYFARSRKRVRIDIDDALIDTTIAAVVRARELARGGAVPPPLVNSTRCEGCSLVGICLPDETNLLAGLEPARVSPVAESFVDEFLPAALEVEGEPERAVELRRLQPARDDRLPLYVQEQGARIGMRGEELVVHGRNEEKAAHVRLSNTSQVCLIGNVQMSTQALRTTIEHGIPVSLFTTGGWLCGQVSGIGSKNIELRVAQHRLAADREQCVQIARRMIASKIRNSRTMLRRNHASPSDVELFELEQLAKKAERCERLESLLGIEGTAARTYFGAFAGMLKGEASSQFVVDGRNRRPPRDPVNALLSFSYSLLAKEFVNALSAAGLEPLLGFYHQPRFGRPSLALDLMEEFRPILADSTVITALNTGVVDVGDFMIHPTGVSLKSHGRRRFIQAFERRMDQLVTHPIFGYRVSYRRIIEVQARLLGRFILGEFHEYPEFRTR